MKFISLLVIVMFLAVLLLAIAPLYADEKTWIDDVADVISGRHDDVPVDLAVSICKEIPTKIIPGLNLIPFINTGRTQIGVKGLTPMGQDFGEYGRGEIEVKVIF